MPAAIGVQYKQFSGHGLLQETAKRGAYVVRARSSIVRGNSRTSTCILAGRYVSHVLFLRLFFNSRCNSPTVSYLDAARILLHVHFTFNHDSTERPSEKSVRDRMRAALYVRTSGMLKEKDRSVSVEIIKMQLHAVSQKQHIFL